MSVNQDHFRQLLDKYAGKQATPEELEELFALIKNSSNDKDLHQLLVSALEGTEPISGDEKLWGKQFDQMLIEAKNRETSEEKSIPYFGWRKLMLAASIILALSFGGYLLLHKEKPAQVAQNDPEQIAPVQNSVVLTLANGQRMVLRKKHSGQIANMGGTQINQQDSLLNYQGHSVTDESKMNTLTNNGSAKFSLTLTDGTVAILDIGSSLTYPAAFGSGTRSVSMTGQAYFKVKHIAGQAFVVAYNGQTTEDIGTEFNINAFTDEPAIKTTLIVGSIRVNSDGNKDFLKPGEQAIKRLDQNKLLIKTVNLEDVTAWLQSQLIFHHETLENIMRDVARIYNVTIVWQDQDVRKLTFGGSVTRNEKLATVLNYFRKAGGVDFLVKGKTVKVIKHKK